jgi:hypothetical protein
MRFEQLQLEPDQQCAYDFIEVYDSHLAENSLGKFCEMPSNDSEVRLTLSSTKSAFLIHFHSDQLLNSKGFQSVISIDRDRSGDSCDWRIMWHNKTIASPGFPANYPPNSNCELELQAPSKSQRVVLLFDSLQMEVDANCSSDRLEIWNVDDNKQIKTPERTLCGRKSGQFKFISKADKIKLRFISDDFAEFAGKNTFLLKFSCFLLLLLHPLYI